MKNNDKEDKRYEWTTISGGSGVFDLVLIALNLVSVFLGFSKRKEQGDRKKDELLIWAKTLEKKHKKEKNG